MEEKISELEDRAIKTIQKETQKKRLKRNEHSISELWNNFKQPNTSYSSPQRRE